MRDRKLTTGQGLIAYWLPITIALILAGVLLCAALGAPKAGAFGGSPITGKSKCATARGEKTEHGLFGRTLYWGSIAFTFCTNVKTGVITYVGTPRPHWGLGDMGRLNGWHADGRCGGDGPRRLGKRKGTLTRALCYRRGLPGLNQTRRIVFTIGYQGYVGGPSWYCQVSPPS